MSNNIPKESLEIEKKKAGTPGLESPSEPVYVFIKLRI